MVAQKSVWFSVYEKELHKEFEWLLQEYPLPLFSKPWLKILPSNISDSKRLDGYITEEENNHLNDFAFHVLLEIQEDFELDTLDSRLLQDKNIPAKHFPFWMLYHEYGHLVDMHRIVEKEGKIALQKQQYTYQMMQDELVAKHAAGKITEEEMKIAYRNLPMEKYADNFADNVYKIRKKYLRYKI